MPVLAAHPGTCYLRLGRGGEPTIHKAPISDYRLGQAICLREGDQAVLFSSGGILTQVMAAAEQLSGRGIRVGVYSFPTLKPIDEGLIRRLAKEVPLIATVEEHTVIGGLGGAVCEVVGGMQGSRARILRIGMQDQYSAIVGTQQYLREMYGMDGASIAKKVEEALGEKL